MKAHNHQPNRPSGIPPNSDFIRNKIAMDLKSNENDGCIITRFPPEPNGYLHIGHAKSAILNFGIAAETGGVCHLRFDDTNPAKEDIGFAESIQEDLRWLGLDWGCHLYYSSDYFDQLYKYAVQLIKKGRAYICNLSQEEIREYRGTLREPGKESPFRDRTVKDNLSLFERMRNGEFEDGHCVLRAKIDMKSTNLNLRDPVIYRIMKVPHYRTGREWSIYPTYDFAHGQSDSIEGVTHSICTLEFEDHRPLYDWLLDELQIHHPQQIEFARLNLNHTIMSKRKLIELVEEKHVTGWDDPRMPTLSGMRRRGYTPESIWAFCERIGVARRENTVEIALLEHCVREDLNKKANRAMAVLDPLRVIIENYPDGHVEELDALNNPEDLSMGSRQVIFSRELFIERSDFLEELSPKFFRLAPGQEVRLRYGYFIKCVSVVKDSDTGRIIEVRCTYDPETRGGRSPDGRKVKGTIHWVSASHSITAEVRLYDHLFTAEKPDEAAGRSDYISYLNPTSLEILYMCRLEASLSSAKTGIPYQFERLGYFCMDPKDSTPTSLVFNRTVSLRDSWSKIKNT